MDIQRLSTSQPYNNSEASALLMVGSFAPVHNGHLDAMESAERTLIANGEDIAGNIFVPNSDSYVLQKLNDTKGRWNFDRRVSEFLKKEATTNLSLYVDDITGSAPPELSISEEAIKTSSELLGIQATSLVLVVGTDQMESMRPHIETNRAVCVIRPGYDEHLSKMLEKKWFKQAAENGRFILTNRQNILDDISSTAIRRVLESTAQV